MPAQIQLTISNPTCNIAVFVSSMAIDQIEVSGTHPTALLLYYLN